LQTVYFGLQLLDELRPLLGENPKDSPEFIVVHIFGGVPKSVMTASTGFDQRSENGNHSVVTHKNRPTLSTAANAVPRALPAI
jgi:hypothetical protein